MVASRTYLSTPSGMKLTVPPNTVLPYFDPGPGPGPSSRFFGDPGVGNMYWGLSNMDDNPTRESYFGQRVGVSRTYWNIGTVESGNGSGYQNAITAAGNDLAAGRVPWLSFKLTTNGPTKTFDASWSQAASGTVDTRINQILTGLNAAGGVKGPIFITWHHEPNGDGVASQYLAMCRHMQALMAPYPKLVHVGGVLSAGYYQMSAGGGYNAADWMQSDSCDIFGLDIYTPWNPVNGKDFNTVDQSFRLGGIAECLAIDPTKPIALGELGCKTDPPTGGSAGSISTAWMQGGYDYMRASNVIACAWFDSGVGSGEGGWWLDKNYQEVLESPAPRLIKFKEILLKPTSKLIPLGGASS